MPFDSALDRFLLETTTKSLGFFGPELMVCGTVVLMLLARVANLDRRIDCGWIAIVGTLAAISLAIIEYRQLFETLSASGGSRVEYFTGMLVHDPLTVFLRLLLLVGTLLVIMLAKVGGVPDREDSPDFHSLVLGALVGMLLMAGTNHLLMLFLSVEMASVPAYALAGFLKGRRQGSEAALKFVVFGAGSAGILLFGLSLVATIAGTAEMGLLSDRLRLVFANAEPTMADPLLRTLALGVVMIFAGLFFKLSAFPFHFWCPDVFEGAAAEVGALLATISKAATLGLCVRLLLALATPIDGALGSVYVGLGVGLGVAGAISCTFGNLAAFFQDNFKRLMAYSAIGQAGYFLMALGAIPILVNLPGESSSLSNASGTIAGAVLALDGLLYYLVVYVFMNLAVFAAIIAVRNRLFSEELESYQGLGLASPLLAFCLALALFSLIGIPPLGGFFGKMAMFAALVQAADASPIFWVFLGVGILNTVLSVFYYLNVLRVMCLMPRPDSAKPFNLPIWSPAGLYLALTSSMCLVLGLWIEPVSQVVRLVTRALVG